MLMDEHVPAVPQDEGAAAEPANGIADFGAGKAADHGDDADDSDVEASPARASEDRPGDERELAWHHGDAYILQEQQEGDRPVPVVVERANHRLKEAGQHGQ